MNLLFVATLTVGLTCPEVNHNLKGLAPDEDIKKYIQMAGNGCRQRGFECVTDLMFDGMQIRVSCGSKVEKEGRERR